MVKLGLVWLLCSLITVFETTVGAHAAAINGCDRKNCQKTVYDIHEAACCENQIYPGAGLSCCGGTAFNPAAATCCKEEHGHNVTANVTEGLSEMVSACCGLSAYNPLNEICCDSTVVTKSVADAQCCGSEAYDEHKQLCCGPMDNRTVLVRESSHHQCCGHKQFNTKTHCCCWTNGSLDIHHIHAKCCKEESALCGTKAYNNFTELCCQSTIVAKPPPNAQCCGKEAYDEHKQLCCGPMDNRTVLVRESSHHQCCGHKQFNTKTHCCCWTNGSLDIHHIHAKCCKEESALCGTKAYNNFTELCCQSTIVAKPPPNAQCCGKEAYDEHKQLCCGPMDNRTVLVRESSHHQCCGHKQFNTKTHCCCWTNGSLDIHHIHAKCCKEESALCGTKAYNNFTELCCQSTIVAKPPPNAQCCGKEAYDEHKQLCCGPMDNRTVLVRESSHHQCCGHKQFNTKTHCCCWTNGSLDIHHIHAKCCKEESEAFDDVKQLLCGLIGQDRTILTRTSIDHECCGHEQFNTKTECCCWTNESLQIHPKSPSCCVEESGVQPLKPGSQPTCTEPETSICGSSCYNPKEFRCCERKQSNLCCISGKCDAAPAVYNPTTDVCCDGRVSERRRRPNQHHGSPGHCCGTEVYWPHAEICCDGHRHPKEKNVHCCGAQTYHIKNPQMKCCAGTLYNLTLLGHEAQCCGSILQKPQDVCCSHEEKTVLWSAKTGFRCCAHLYYNTSLWACCKGKLSPVHQPGHHQNKMEYRLQSLNNLSELELCKELRVGTVESVSSHSTVFGRVLKFHGGRGVVEALPWPYILEAPDHCNSPTLIPGKTYFFDADNIFTDPNHDSVLQSLHFILCKCGHC